MRPLQVYLDSSDFSKLSDEKALAVAGRRDLRDYLMNRVHAGHIDVRVSSVHVSEAAPHDKDAVAWARQRADLIETLSRGKAIRYFDEVDRGDLAVAFQIPGYRFPDHALDDNGAWWPDVSDIAQGVQSMMMQAIRETLAPLPRARRRELERTLLDRRGQLSEAGKRIYRDTFPATLMALQDQLPVSESFLRAWMEVFDRPEASDTLVAELRRALQDVHVFMKWFCTHGKTGVLGTCLHAPIQNARAGLESLRDLYRKAVELQSALDLPKGEAHLRLAALAEANTSVLRCGLAMRALNDHRSWLMARGVSAVRLDSVNPDELTMPKIEALSDLMGEWFLLNVGGNRTILDSDFGDIAHLCHAPYVDVIRCDGFAWHVSRRVREKWPGTIFVRRLDELQGAIEDRMR